MMTPSFLIYIKKSVFYILLGHILILQSCTTAPTWKMAAVASLDQKIGHDGTITSQKNHFVSLTPYTEMDNAIPKIGFAKDKRKFMLTVRNCGEAPINMGTDNISVLIEDAGVGSMARKISVQSLDGFMIDFEREYNENEKKFLYTTLYEVYRLCDIGFMDSETATDHMLDLKFDLEAMRRQKNVLGEMLPGTVLTDQTIMPGSTYTGIVICDTIDMGPETVGRFRIAVSVGEEQHLFIFHWDFSAN